MKLLVPIAAIIATASAGHVYASQLADTYAHSAELYQSQLEYQQQGLYSDQPQTFAGHGGHQARSGEKNAKILSFVSERDGHGYQYAYETENGIKAQESGQGHDGTVAQGAYSYTGDDGHVYTVTYTADEHGFHAQGSHLPTPPPMPEEIAKSLEQNAKDEAAGIYDDGKYVNVQEEQHIQHQVADQGHQLQHQQQFQSYEAPTYHHDAYAAHLKPPTEGLYKKH